MVVREQQCGRASLPQREPHCCSKHRQIAWLLAGSPPASRDCTHSRYSFASSRAASSAHQAGQAAELAIRAWAGAATAHALQGTAGVRRARVCQPRCWQSKHRLAAWVTPGGGGAVAAVPAARAAREAASALVWGCTSQRPLRSPSYQGTRTCLQGK